MHYGCITFILGSERFYDDHLASKSTGVFLFKSFLFYRFSQFFISPLVKAEAMEREVMAVDSGP